VDGVLQHGSLPLCGDIGRVCKYLVGAPEPERVRLHAATLSEVVGRPMTYEETAKAWRSAFTDILDIHFTVGVMSEEEVRCADDLRVSRYGNDVWNRRR
jgi:lipoate-protein ligase A